MEKLNVSYIHVQKPITNWGISDVSFDPLLLFRPYYTGTLIVGGALDFESATMKIKEGQADAVTFGRAWLANPDLIERFKTDTALNEVDATTFYSQGAEGYIDYPVFHS